MTGRCRRRFRTSTQWRTPVVRAAINGGTGAAMGDGAGHVTFYVVVPDLEAALSKIEDLGGSTVMGPTKVPEGPTIAMFADPEESVYALK